ncbi:circadian clock-controlled protein daywake-like [Anticarsia gemmatalis]|uniref:circadian clock-controlled protein daywake-like n=1 Tax=Anticarsia gemmatalis TaxID=129554 RepID=UPI003F76CFEB
MFTLYSFILLSLVYITHSENGFLPPYISPCELSTDKFVDCVKKQIVNSLPKFTKGVPEMGVPSIDPVHLDNIEIDGNGLKLSFSEAAMHGLSKCRLTDLKVDIGKSEETFSLAFKGNLSLVAKYVVDGRILILPIQGKGDALVDAQGVEVKIDSKLVHVKDTSGEHFKLATPKYKYTIEKTTFDLKNLFNGNKQLAETTLQFANENWQQLMDELAPPAIKQIVRTVVKAINKFFSKVPIKQIVIGYKESQ